MIAAVLLVPTDGDPHGLLREGPCGARPPMAGEVQGEWQEQPEDDGGYGVMFDWGWEPARPTREALVLAWDGKPSTEGVDRAWRRAQVVGGGSWYEMPTAAPMTLDKVDGWADSLADTLGCAVILLDAEGREVPS